MHSAPVFKLDAVEGSKVVLEDEDADADPGGRTESSKSEEFAKH